MKILKKSITLCFLIVSMSTLANTSPKTISVISNGKTVASLEVPLSTKLEVSAEKVESNADRTKTYFKGKAKMSLTLPSGEIMNINADELEIFSEALIASKTGK